jgi:hypothetical protein
MRVASVAGFRFYTAVASDLLFGGSNVTDLFRLGPNSPSLSIRRSRKHKALDRRISYG